MLLLGGILLIGITTLLRPKVSKAPQAAEQRLTKYEETPLTDTATIKKLLKQFSKYGDFSISTEQRPYTLAINHFNASEGKNIGFDFSSDRERNQTLLYRASLLFLLIPSVEKITITYGEDSVFSATKKDLETLLQLRFEDYSKDSNAWAQAIQEKIWSENFDWDEVNELFIHFPEGLLSQELAP